MIILNKSDIKIRLEELQDRVSIYSGFRSGLILIRTNLLEIANGLVGDNYTNYHKLLSNKELYPIYSEMTALSFMAAKGLEESNENKMRFLALGIESRLDTFTQTL